MNQENFEATIRGFQNQAPFEKFSIRLISGSEVTVDHPEAVVVRNGFAVYLDPQGLPNFFDNESVSEILQVGEAGKAA